MRSTIPQLLPQPFPQKTGWPPPILAQDDCRELFRWFAGRLGSRRLVRESLACKQTVGGMMDDDRKLLEVAAEAAGIKWDSAREAWDAGTWKKPWNPLTDDGDAFRLAVRLGLFFRPEFMHYLSLERFGRQDREDCFAHRRAIVRAAAALKEKP